MSLNQQLTTEGRRPTHSIIIPAYNEGARLGITLKKVLAYVAQRGSGCRGHRGSNRHSPAEIGQRYAGKNSRLRLLENPGNRDKGYCVRNGMMHPQREILMFSDADLSLRDAASGETRTTTWLPLTFPHASDCSRRGLIRSQNLFGTVTQATQRG